MEGSPTPSLPYDDRSYISGAFFETMNDPLFVVKKPYKGGWNTIFYKPFMDAGGKYHLGAFAVNESGVLVHKTFFKIDNLSKTKELIKVPDSHLLYEKHPNQPTTTGSPDYTSHTNGMEKDAEKIIPKDDSGVKLGVFAGDALKSKKHLRCKS